LEANRLYSLAEIATTLIKRHCDTEELETRTELQRGEIYQPSASYETGANIIFPQLDFALGTVQHVRDGNHPEYGRFKVMGIVFEGSTETREFVTGFDYPQALNISDDTSLANIQGLLSAEELYQTYGESIRKKLKDALDTHRDFVEFHDQYFLRDLLVDLHEGLFNIADAAIDINGGPLGVDTLIEQMGLADGQELTDVLRFSVNYQLDNDPRFDDVGPAGQVCWYLERLEPPEAHHPPRRLQAGDQQPYDPDSFDEALRALLAEIDDELTDPEDIPPTPPHVNSTTIVLNYPHWRVGSFPLTPKTQSFFLISYYNPVRFEFVDGRTGDTFPGWVVFNHKYVFGLEEWYRKNKLPVGAYLTIKRTPNPLQVIIDYQTARAQREWIRVASVVSHQLTFRMNTQAISCKYDELMIIDDANPTAVDRVWLNAEEKDLALYDILCHVLPELSKLSPQSTVHAKTLYSAVNVIRRFSPGDIFRELNEHACFVPMNYGYWTFDANLRED
ncbi:MAG: hypothetical protein AB1801_27440, partial [Chloroflexota bacterium]